MSNKTKIEWCDYTWNPIIGCSKISEGCQNCYAEKMAGRLSNMPHTHEEYKNVVWWGVNKKTDVYYGEQRWNGKTHLIEKALNKKFTGKGKKIFVCSMSDLFHENNLDEDISKVINKITDNKQHTFLILTKRPERMRGYFLKRFSEHVYIANLWLGVTVENQQRADERIPILLQIPAKVRFVSVEPMLGPVDLTKINTGTPPFNYLTGCFNGTKKQLFRPLDWVICGAETGPNKRIMNNDWAMDLQRQCKEANVPFFFKKNSLGYPFLNGEKYLEFPERR